MITNERQYRITRRKARDFAHVIEEFNAESCRIDVHPRLVHAEREAMKSQLADLQQELEEYEQLKSAEILVISVGSFEELADGLDQGQIAGPSTGACTTSKARNRVPRYEQGAILRKLAVVCPVAGCLVENDILLPSSG